MEQIVAKDGYIRDFARTRQRPVGADGESGAVLITVLFGVVALIALAALVLDLAAVRVNRAVSQVVTDAAATAAAIEAEGTDGRSACETALDYLELNLPQAGPFSGADCLTFTASCDAATPAASTTATAGSWVANLTYPVPDASPLLTSSVIGKPTQPLHPDDGDACERFGVSVQSTHEYLFAQILGATSGTTEIHSVARGFVPDESQFALNLLILERYECDALSANTSGGNSGIIVDSVWNTDKGRLDPGYIAVDSDASVCGPKGVIAANGSGALVRADGPEGCAGQLGTHVDPVSGLLTGEGCGEIQLIAPGVPGCNHPACTSSGVIAPDPISRKDRITRAPVDHRYNCKSNYPMPAGWEIDGCGDTPDPFIDDLVADLGGPGTPATYTSWTSAGFACNPGPMIAPPGNWHVDCNDFKPKGTISFLKGNVIFDGDVTLGGLANLAINANGSTPFPHTSGHTEGIVFFRDGTLRKGAQSSLFIHHSTIYMSDTSDLRMNGGSGAVGWSAPSTGDFAGLALWYESADDIAFGGSAGLSLDGVFFAPWATIDYGGSGSQEQVSAQFIARKLEVSGNGTLVVRPRFENAVKVPLEPQSQLIR